MEPLDSPVARPPMPANTRVHTPVDTHLHADAAESPSAVSWAAIFAGAAGAASLSLILLVLGAGLGFSTMSPWASRGADADTIGIGAIVWLAFVAIVASGTGGYLAGRLRVKWTATHTDEVYFRDTAHGFLSWSVATLVTAGLLSSSIASIVGTGAELGGTAAATAATAATGGAAGLAKIGTSGVSPATMPGMADAGYFSDSLFRPQPAGAGASAPAAASSMSPDAASAASADAGKVFARALRTGQLAPEDATYLVQAIAQRTGMSQEDATKRVNDTYAKAQAALQDAMNKAKEAADKARKAAAYAFLWLFFSLLLGAFTASYAATLGGRQRDI